MIANPPEELKASPDKTEMPEPLPDLIHRADIEPRSDKASPGMRLISALAKMIQLIMPDNLRPAGSNHDLFPHSS